MFLVFIDFSKFFRYSPPAKAVFSWSKVWLQSLSGQQANFQEELKRFLKAEAVVVADAWVNLLAEGLRSLPRSTQKEIILPAYACNEFYKAILLADLVPVPVDLTTSGTLSPEAVKAVINHNTLALMAVNNTGVCADLDALRALCDASSIWMVEDAGYTLFGLSEGGKPFGSFGHASIINMSEGKIIPVGGAAWVVNEQTLLPAAKALATSIAQQAAEGNAKSLLKLLIYRLGSSRWGFAAYQQAKSWGFGDLKAKFTNEPSRLGEDYASGNLIWASGAVILEPVHRSQLEQIALRPWSRVRHLVAKQIFENRMNIATFRSKRLTEVLALLPSTLEPMLLPQQGMPVKLPVLLTRALTVEQAMDLAAFGFKKQYPPSWPMAQWPYPNSQRFYQAIYTWPIHEGVTSKMRLALVEQLITYR
jgi:hypothetical protein